MTYVKSTITINHISNAIETVDMSIENLELSIEYRHVTRKNIQIESIPLRV